MWLMVMMDLRTVTFLSDIDGGWDSDQWIHLKNGPRAQVSTSYDIGKQPKNVVKKRGGFGLI